MTAMTAVKTESSTDNKTQTNTVLWAPKHDQFKNTYISKFMDIVSDRYQVTLDNYDDLWEWSIQNIASFWSELWDYVGIVGEKGSEYLRNPHKMPDAEFFPDAQINYAENMLRYCAPDQDHTTRAKDAVVFWGEDKVKRRLSRAELYDQVSQLAQFLRSKGVTKGDRVAGFVANTPEALIGMLATSSIGAIWSSASPDFGAQGVLDRFGQIEPKVLIATEGYYYNGKEIDCLAKIKDFSEQMPSLEHVILTPYLRPADKISNELASKPIENALIWDHALAEFTPQEIEFARGGFNDPLYIMFSSGTTGVPKCIVHGAGGTLIQHLKEHALQCNTGLDDRVFYFTTCGWMMWNWQVTALAAGATLCLYDGSPFAPSPNILFDYAD